ncbi:hypothetical protein GB937_010091 [Aspergillus fischeri]|nr:hypothetical protein GB937_010091 [Aspergillus fischeri]
MVATSNATQALLTVDPMGDYLDEYVMHTLAGCFDGKLHYLPGLNGVRPFEIWCKTLPVRTAPVIKQVN